MDLRDLLNDQSPRRNLLNSLYALGFSVLASFIGFFAMDAFVPGGGGRFMIWLWSVLYFAMIIVSGVFAFVAVKNSLMSLKTNKDNRNYIALVIGGILLLGVCRMIFNYF